MSEAQKKKSLIAEKRLKEYQKKKFGKIDYGWVSEGVSQAWLRRFYETDGFKRVRKKGH